MLAQFQSLYPNSSIISELVQIFQGKYIVRVTVQIEGITRSTGMAGAETVEAAEDQARNRALMVLGITKATGETGIFTPKPISSIQVNPSFNPRTISDESGIVPKDVVSNQSSTVSNREISAPDTYNPVLGQSFPEHTTQEQQLDPPGESLKILSDQESEHYPFLPEITPSNVTPFTPRSYSPPEDIGVQLGIGTRKRKNEPVNLSDVIAQTDVQIERLGWTKEQGREFLKKTYGKLGRSLLSEEELLDFLNYLKSQPDPIAGF
ncbi:hypothetical protein [Trichormus sp. NMC-1]|uniref:hypothetical protein n=1 Tax=Trichormus sp. NMC-1 TaxID=1853259 RepID=UPI0008DC15CD|nr:hypothetical protein [Trichormus sp. NMC-1]